MKVRIINKARFVIGIYNILLGIIALIVLIVQHRIREFLLAGVVFACGVINIIYSLETNAQRQKRKEELQEMARMYGWDKRGDEDENN